MTFNPMLHPAIIAVFALAALAVVVLALRGGAPKTRWIVRAVFVVAVATAMLRPGLPGGEVEVLAENTDVFVVVDTSASIVAEDWGDGQPRLAGVREDVQAIVDAYPGARFSLVTFDSETQVRLPLTTDSSALISAMSVLTPEVTAHSSGSSVTQASGVLKELLSAASKSGADRARMVFYLGDGEQTAPSEPGSFGESRPFVDSGMVFGYGTDAGGPMRVTTITPEGGPTVDGAVDGSDGAAHEPEYIEYRGERALSQIDEANLQLIADQLEVGYELRSVDTQIVLPEPPKSTSRNVSGTVGSVVELYWIPAAVALAALAFEIALISFAVTRVLRLEPREQSARTKRERNSAGKDDA